MPLFSVVGEDRHERFIFGETVCLLRRENALAFETADVEFHEISVDVHWRAGCLSREAGWLQYAIGRARDDACERFAIQYLGCSLGLGDTVGIQRDINAALEFAFEIVLGFSMAKEVERPGR